MLLVLGIISFLILALPPLVHKKFTKRISRGEHGRYECWKDTEGNTYEYYATEKNGTQPEYIGADRGGTVKAPLGRKLAAGERCTFNPRTMAPNAAYFSFQAIGGGSGGSYAPYNGSDTQYRNDTFTKEALIKSAYGDSYRTPTTPNALSGINESKSDSGNVKRITNYNDFFWSKKIVKKINEEGETEETNLMAHYNEAEAFLDYDYHKTNGIKILMAEDNDLYWLKDYFTSVKATEPLIIQTPAGDSGTPYLDKSGFTESESLDGTKKYRHYTFVWGGKGNPGYQAEFSDPRVGYNEPITINFSYATAYDSGVGDLSEYFASTSKYALFYKYNLKLDVEAPGHYKVGWNKLCTEDNPVEGCTKIEYIDNPPLPEEIEIGCMTLDKSMDRYSMADPCWMPSATADGYNLKQPVSYTQDNEYGMSAMVTFNQREDKKTPFLIAGGGPDANNCARSGAKQTIIVPYGETGINATADMTEQPGPPDVPSGVGTIGACEPKHIITQMSDRSVTRLTFSKKLEDIFPKEITMTNERPYITPTYGYAGGSGKSVLMMLPALKDNLEFEIGNGGAAGTQANHIGGVASDTIVWEKGDNVNTVCTEGTTGCARMFDAKGGVGVMGGAASTRIFLRGIKTNCEFGKRSADGIVGFAAYNTDQSSAPELTVEQAAGCIDNGVGTYEEAPKRFSISSGFYAIPELDSSSKTPSAIDTFYKSVYSYTVSSGKKLTFMPGTGGNGGYSFIVKNDGNETITAQGHTNFNATTIKLEKKEYEWVANGDNSIKKTYRNILPNLEAIKKDYKCYLIDDSDEGLGSGDGYGEQFGFEEVDDKVYACKPSTGYPGAAVIIW